jgi:7-carboxy-7-deazaguanine synthase
VTEVFKLPVMEIFATIQGEGFHTGKPAVFIRLAGCDIACQWCDVQDSWNSSAWPQMDLEEIIEKAVSLNIPAAVITGGEPLLNNMEQLTGKLLWSGIATFLETSGSHPLTGNWDWICLSPKKQFPPLPEIVSVANELKVVIASADDLRWAEEMALMASPDCYLYLQPEWSVRSEVLPVLVNYILKNPSWMLSLQSHKYIGIP